MFPGVSRAGEGPLAHLCGPVGSARPSGCGAQACRAASHLGDTCVLLCLPCGFPLRTNEGPRQLACLLTPALPTK